MFGSGLSPLPNSVAGNTIGQYLDHIDPYRFETQRRTIIHEDKPPSKKYFKPAEVADSFSL